MTVVRRRVEVTGLVQGVGFRPHVFAICETLGLNGFVGNSRDGVFIEVEGSDSSIGHFIELLVGTAPALSRIDDVDVTSVAPTGVEGFVIVASTSGATSTTTLVAPDAATCLDCLGEMRDPNDRRYGYPFIACTNCGPRFSIVTGLPYDRPNTTMAAFELCDRCQAEYDDPHNRRFHAQSTGCWTCGPVMSFRDVRGADVVGTRESIRRCVEALWSGEIVAIKGIGGYHLCCDATNTTAVARLRLRKHRKDKPFAIMVRDLESARRVVMVSPAAEEALASTVAPIVLAPVADDDAAQLVAAGIAPGLAEIGVMVAATPLQHRLFDDYDGRTFETLVMTSGNLSGEPVCTDNHEAETRLGAIADAWLHHDRRIVIAVDDSVFRTSPVEVPVRCSRGLAPAPFRLMYDAAPMLAVGGELKATLCVARGTSAVMSQHIGDTTNLETLDMLARVAEVLVSLTGVEPETVVADQHPGYLSAAWARQYALDRGAHVSVVQHHHAHLASLLVDNSMPSGEPVLGVVFDGSGYGLDGAIWGGEFLFGSYDACQRIGHLRPIALPGGDAAIRRPLRSALAQLHDAGIDWDESQAMMDHSDEIERGVVARMLKTNVSCATTTSVGRLFDAVASLLDVCHDASYEAQAAMELEAIAASMKGARPTWGFDVHDGPLGLELDPRPVLAGVVEAMRGGTDRRAAAWHFHEALADGIVRVASHARRNYGQLRVGLSGGVFQNTKLVVMVRDRLNAASFEVLTHRSIPPNDAGISIGQIAVCAAKQGL